MSLKYAFCIFVCSTTYSKLIQIGEGHIHMFPCQAGAQAGRQAGRRAAIEVVPNVESAKKRRREWMPRVSTPPRSSFASLFLFLRFPLLPHPSFLIDRSGSTTERIDARLAIDEHSLRARTGETSIEINVSSRSWTIKTRANRAKTMAAWWAMFNRDAQSRICM